MFIYEPEHMGRHVSGLGVYRESNDNEVTETCPRLMSFSWSSSVWKHVQRVCAGILQVQTLDFINAYITCTAINRIAATSKLRMVIAILRAVPVEAHFISQPRFALRT
jgi:hypothetical protein